MRAFLIIKVFKTCYEILGLFVSRDRLPPSPPHPIHPPLPAPRPLSFSSICRNQFAEDIKYMQQPVSQFFFSGVSLPLMRPFRLRTCASVLVCMYARAGTRKGAQRARERGREGGEGRFRSEQEYNKINICS